MSFRRAATVTGTSILLFASAALVATGCGGGSTTKTGTGGATGGGGQGSGGHGTGGMGTGGVVVDAGPVFPNCTPFVANTALILDFTTVPNPSQATFGVYNTSFNGGTYQYPAAIAATFTGMNWHMTGTVGDYSGFGLYLQCKSDVSAFTGIQFDIGGTFAGGDGGTSAAHVTMNIGNPVDELDTAHASMPPTWGTCTAGCAAPTRDVLIPATSATVTAPWTSFGGGTPVGSLDPTQILYVAFAFPWSGTMTPYTVDITIDNIMFMGGTPPDGGTPDAPADVATTDTGTPDTAPADVATTDTGTRDTGPVGDAAGN